MKKWLWFFVMTTSIVLLPVMVGAQGKAQDSAAFSVPAFMHAVHVAWGAPRAAEFARDGARLWLALQALCDAAPENAEAALIRARQAWLAALLSWERLEAVSIGPLIERRSQRQIDFLPTRPRMIEKAVKSAPASLADMELIGTPAKGFPALEWLLWKKPAQPASPECRYVLLVADEIGREASKLEEAYRQAASRKLGNEAASLAFGELVNQWVGGLEHLRWHGMEMPVRVAMTTKARDEPDFPRSSSGADEKAWAAQWETLRTLAAGKDISLETVLRAKGAHALADSFASAVGKADAAMQGLQAKDPARVIEAGQQLAALKRLVEEKIAPTLGVPIGFSDADGD